MQEEIISKLLINATFDQDYALYQQSKCSGLTYQIIKSGESVVERLKSQL